MSVAMGVAVLVLLMFVVATLWGNVRWRRHEQQREQRCQQRRQQRRQQREE